MELGWRTGLVRKIMAVVLLLSALGVLPAPAAPSDIPNPATWVTNGPVDAIACTPGTVYLGGSFTWVGPATGGGVPLNTSTGQAAGSFPKVIGSVNAQVYACAADGTGGWYIGGEFSQVGTLARTNIAHILADGRVDPAWSATPNARVLALAVAGGKVYVGGEFTTINRQTRQFVAALDAASGALTAWNPNATSYVQALVVVGGTIYAGGSFTEIGGQIRHCLAALDASTGLATAWDPEPSYPVYALAVSGTTVYAGGEFTNVGGQVRNHLAAIDASTGLATAWDPNVNNPVYALAVAGGVVYAGGMFTMVGGKTRNYIAALDAASGLATAWNPNAGGDVNALAIAGNTVYAGGWFTGIGGQVRRHLAALNASTGAATAWNADTDDTVLALAVASGTVYAGGRFTSLGGQARNHLAALDAATGAATAWNPNASADVYALAVSGGTVYAGGNFTTMGGQPRNFLAAMDAASGAVKPWNPNANGYVYALAASGAMVYAGGGFSLIGGQMRPFLAALDAASGAVMAWKVDPDNTVSALAASGATVYAGGDFTRVGGQSRIGISALDAASGAVTSWYPEANGPVEAFAVSGGTVYAGGYFWNIGGKTRNYLAALDAPTGTITGWNPNASNEIRALAILGGAVYAGGYFTSVGGQARGFLAALDASGTATAWNPNANSVVRALAVSGRTVYAGGNFTSIGGRPQAYFAQFDTLVTSPPAAPTSPGASDVQTDRLTWTWADASDNEDGFKVWANPGTGAPTTLRTTTAADATSWLYSGLSPNAPYTFQVAATNSLGDSARSAACTAWTQIEPISDLNFLSVTQTSIAVAPANTPSNLASGFSGIYISNDTAATASGWQQSAAPWVSSSLTPNTQYAFRGRSRNGERVSGANAAASQWTLAAPPIYGINVICDQTTGTAYPLGTAFTFTNPAGSGPGTHGGSPYMVSYFRFAWDESPTCSFTGSESHWSAYLYETPPSPGSYYLHLQSLNGIGAATAQTLDVGPFIMAAPPKITASPLGQTVNPGARVTFSVTASGTAPLSYQWKKNGAAISGATAASYTINAAADSNEGEYICVVTNRVGSASSTPAVLVVVNPPIISMQSSSQAVDRGAGVTLFVSAYGGTPFSYQWRKNGNPIPGATADRYAITAAQPADDADYDCMVSNSAGSATSKVIHLTVNYPPTITRQPLSQAVNLGARVTFTVAAAGTEPLDYMWFKDGTLIPGATSPSYAIAAARESDEGSYHCLVSNATGWEASNPATLTVNIPPTFTLQPLSQTVNPGARVTFSVTASGTAPLSYQWKKNGAAISGAYAASYTITSVDMSDAAFYSCVVTSTDGTAISNPARLVVNPTLTVASAYGTPAPSVGAHVYTTGTLVSVSVSGSPIVDTTGTTCLACTGWTGTGSLAASGTTTQTSFRLGLDSALTWRWQTQYRLDAAATPPGAGRVTLGDGVTNAAGSWHNAASLIGIKAVPNPGYALAGWSGDAGGTATTCPLSMTRPRAVAARFVRAGVLTPDRTGLSFLKGSRWEVDVTHGGVPTTQTLTLTNTGELPISFTGGTAGTPGLALAGRCAGDFSIQGVSPATSTPLAPGASVRVTIRFAPQRTQYTLGLDAALVVTSTSPWVPALTIPLLGDAVPVKLSGFKAE